MSFLPFFFFALEAGDDFDGDKYAAEVRAGQALLEGSEVGIRKIATGQLADLLRPLVMRSYIDDALREPRRALYHLARYLAANGDLHGAGQLVKGQMLANQARTDAGRTARRLKKDLRTRAIRAAAERLRTERGGCPTSNVKLARDILASPEIVALGNRKGLSIGTVCAAIATMGLGAKQLRRVIREANKARTLSTGKAKKRKSKSR